MDYGLEISANSPSPGRTGVGSLYIKLFSLDKPLMPFVIRRGHG